MYVGVPGLQGTDTHNNQINRMQQTIVMCEGINRKRERERERERDFDNFGERIPENGVLVEKILTFEVIGAKWLF